MSSEAFARPAPARTGAPVARPGGASESPRLVTLRVWQLPVRLIHWGLVVTISGLALTGLYIGVPALTLVGAPKVMAWAHSLHLLLAYIFSALLLARLIWMFTGNEWARWDQFIPRHRNRRAMMWVSLKYYTFLQREPPPEVGHNPLAGLTYLVLFLMFLVQIVTGFALESIEDRDGLLSTLFGWTFNLAGIPTVRFVHHLIMWLTLGFVVHHVYSATLIDHEEQSGLMSSMVSGYKTVPADRLPKSSARVRSHDEAAGAPDEPDQPTPATRGAKRA